MENSEAPSAGQGAQDVTKTRNTAPARDAERSQSTLDDTGVSRTHTLAKAGAPIGVFDSGAGGLTILAALRQGMPPETYIYFCGTSPLPYCVPRASRIHEIFNCPRSFFFQKAGKIDFL